MADLMLADREALRPSKQMGGNKILWILDQLFLNQPIDEVRNRTCADQSKSDAAHAFNQCVRALKEHAHLINLMNSMFVHARTVVDEPRNRLQTGNKPARVRMTKAAPARKVLCGPSASHKAPATTLAQSCARPDTRLIIPKAVPRSSGGAVSAIRAASRPCVKPMCSPTRECLPSIRPCRN